MEPGPPACLRARSAVATQTATPVPLGCANLCGRGYGVRKEVRVSVSGGPTGRPRGAPSCSAWFAKHASRRPVHRLH